ncbi:Nucleoporin SEH1-A [Chionoecetes opilio]|uniref:Nucleoporin SEH1-A n=1 Tax=Chionoecetes opilio TaxID=41210 RepID=A0A8J4YKV1_CHIOP|nr:Nucleoporin SEH1-A [Chionoecetes opilio]
MDWVLGKVVDQSDCGASLGNTKITDLVFAEDAVIFADSLEVLVMALEALHEEAKPLGLEVSWLKTKIFKSLVDPVLPMVVNCLRTQPEKMLPFGVKVSSQKVMMGRWERAQTSHHPGTQDSAQGQSSSMSFEVRLAGQFDDHNSTVWRVCWNATGTILASSGDDGSVRLWKANYLDIWRCISTIRGEAVESVAEADSSGGTTQQMGATSTGQHTARYFKLAPTAHPAHLPWH